jgi:glycosyltransferase involved in cell wall biosynthesis
VTSSYPANSSDYAGAFIPGFAEALVARGCTVTVLTPDKSMPKSAANGYEVRWFAWAGSDRALVDFSLTSPADLRRLVSLLRAGERALRALIDGPGLDACLALWAVPSGYLAWRACGRALPYAVWALGSDIHTWARRPLVGTLVRRVLQDARSRFADGVGLAEEVSRITGRDCEFLPSTRRLPAPAPTRPARGAGVKFLFVGRLEPVKGADVIVDAFIRLVHSGVDGQLTLCGAGSLEASLRGEVARAGVPDRVRFAGSQPAAVVAAYMQACDCVVIPSRMESIPIVFSEALQAGAPLLVTDVGDMGTLARQYGLFDPVRPADPAALASAMEDFALHRDEESARYQTARAELLKIFDIGGAADRYLASLDA